jgi:hypothetical protein
MCVWHPQEVNGHFKPTEADKINRIGQLRQGVVKVIENQNSLLMLQKKYTVADMITVMALPKQFIIITLYGGDKRKRQSYKVL